MKQKVMLIDDGDAKHCLFYESELGSTRYIACICKSLFSVVGSIDNAMKFSTIQDAKDAVELCDELEWA